MSRSDLAAIEARWRATPNDETLQQASLSAFREARVDAPLDLLKTSADWRPFIDVADKWFSVPIDASTGFSTAELDAIELRTGWRFPPTLREWWRIAGKHPCCGPWGDTWHGQFIRPDSRCVAEGDYRIAELDFQVGVALVIHGPQRHAANPQVHEHNATEERFARRPRSPTGASVPQIIWQLTLSLLCYFDELPPFVRDDTFALTDDSFAYYDAKSTRPSEPWDFTFHREIDWEAFRLHFQMRACPYEMTFGDVYYDNGSTLVLGYFGLAARTIEKMEEVDAYLTSLGRNTMGLTTPVKTWRTYPERSVDGKRVAFIEPRTGRRMVNPHLDPDSDTRH